MWNSLSEFGQRRYPRPKRFTRPAPGCGLAWRRLSWSGGCRGTAPQRLLALLQDDDFRAPVVVQDFVEQDALELAVDGPVAIALEQVLHDVQVTMYLHRVDAW